MEHERVALAQPVEQVWHTRRRGRGLQDEVHLAPDQGVTIRPSVPALMC